MHIELKNILTNCGSLSVKKKSGTPYANIQLSMKIVPVCIALVVSVEIFHANLE